MHMDKIRQKILWLQLVLASGLMIAQPAASGYLEFFTQALDESAEIRLAAYSLERAALEAETAAFRLDPSIGFSPAVKYSDAIFTLNAGLSAAINIVPSDSALLSASIANIDQQSATLTLESAKAELLYKLLKLYGNTLIARQQAVLAETEAKLAEQKLMVDQARYLRGELSAAEYGKTELSATESRQLLSDSQLVAARAEAELLALLPAGQGSATIESALSEIWIPAFPQLPAFDSLLDTAMHTLPAILLQQNRVLAAEQRLLAVDGAALTASLRAGAIISGHTLGSSFNFSSGVLGFSYDMPALSFPAADTGGNNTGNTSWSINLGGSISLDSSADRSLEKTQAELLTAQELQRLDMLKSSVSAAILNSVDEYERALRSLSNAEAALMRTQELQASTQARAKLGLVADTEQAQITVILERAAFLVLKAKIAVSQALAAVYHSAGLLPVVSMRSL